VRVGSKIYSLYNYVSTNAKTFKVFDIDADTWTPLTTIPHSTGGNSAHAIPALSYYNGQIWAWGRVQAASFPTFTSDGKEYYKYDPGTDTWTYQGVMPFVDGTLGAICVGNYTYLFQQNTNNVWRYDHVNNTFDNGAVVPAHPFGSANGMRWVRFESSGSVISLGASSNQPGVQYLDADTLTWGTPILDTVNQQFAGGYTSQNGWPWLIGGGNIGSGSAIATTRRYSLDVAAWQTQTDLPEAIRDTVEAFFYDDGNIWVISWDKTWCLTPGYVAPPVPKGFILGLAMR